MKWTRKKTKNFSTLSHAPSLYTFFFAMNETFNPYVSLFSNDTFLNLQSRLLSFPRVICLQVLKKWVRENFDKQEDKAEKVAYRFRDWKHFHENFCFKEKTGWLIGTSLKLQVSRCCLDMCTYPTASK